MIEMDFDDIRKFTYKEFVRAGSCMDVLPLRVVKSFDNFRLFIGLKMSLICNGINTGTHSRGSYHYKNLAIDWYFKDAEVTPQLLAKVIQSAASFGFNGVGVYLNRQTGYIGFHFDMRETPASWFASKDKTKDSWEYSALKFNI